MSMLGTYIKVRGYPLIMWGPGGGVHKKHEILQGGKLAVVIHHKYLFFLQTRDLNQYLTYI